MPTPRPPAEIFPANGDMALIGDAFIKTAEGDNVTDAFLSGAQKALSLCREHNIRYAILTESSPSCGSSLIYNGRFEGQKVEGQGVTTALLRQSGVSVYSQFSIEDLISHLKH
ncbi:DUF523 domain-containing protein [Enterovibrio coralii]|uniref:DUF523 domain-containing protein n=1 Tax=Enterovibrio coralii TaxID=294935 RepID=UPI002FC2D8E2